MKTSLRKISSSNELVTSTMKVLMTVAEAVAALENILPGLSPTEHQTVQRAIALMQSAHQRQTRENGEPYCTHPLAVATILADWGADTDSIVAGLLHDVIEDSNVTAQQIEQSFGPTVRRLVTGLTKFSAGEFLNQASMERKIESLRRLFDVMQDDIRVIVIKLADRLHNIRTIHHLSRERQINVADETMQVYYKLCWHLGMNDVRREFANTCVPILHAKGQSIAAEREELIRMNQDRFATIEATIREHDSTGALVSMRLIPHSIATVLQKRHSDEGDEPPFAIIAIGADIDSCYSLLKLFHLHYRPISRRFRDYIAAPTDSSYQTLRTTIVGPDDQLFPLRIRTHQMDIQEQKGILLECFSGKSTHSPGFTWLQRSKALNSSTKNSSSAFWEALQSDILQATIQITINGQEIALPAGSTALDALYAFYQEAAHRTRQVMVNGSLRPLSYTLQSDDVIAVKLPAQNAVQHEWLNWVKTSYARNQILAALRLRNSDEKLTVGQQLLQQEFDHFKLGLIGELNSVQRQTIARHYDRNDFDDVLMMIGEGMLRARDVALSRLPTPGLWRQFRQGTHASTEQFQILIYASEPDDTDAATQLLTLARIHDIKTSTVRQQKKSLGMLQLMLRGTTGSRAQFADFIATLERQEWIAGVSLLPSIMQKIRVFASFATAGLAIVASAIILPLVAQSGSAGASVPTVVALTFFLIAFGNELLLRLLRRHKPLLHKQPWLSLATMSLHAASIVIVAMELLLLYDNQQQMIWLTLAAVAALLCAHLSRSAWQVSHWKKLVTARLRRRAV